jgi:hypothetical protein
MAYSGPEEGISGSDMHPGGDVDGSMVQESGATQQELAPHFDDDAEESALNGDDNEQDRGNEHTKMTSESKGGSPRKEQSARSEGMGKTGNSSRFRRSGSQPQPSSSSTARSISRAGKDQSQIDRLCNMFVDEHSEDLVQRQIDSLISFLQNNENGYVTTLLI